MLDRIRRAYKALQPDTPLYRLHPELADRQHFMSNSAYAWAGAEADGYMVGAAVYRTYVWVRKAVAMKAAAIAPLPVRVVDAQGKVVDSPLNRLFAQPNDQTDGAELWATATTHKELGGEWFLEVVDDARGQPRELWNRRPDLVWVAPDESQQGYPQPAGYELSDLVNPWVPVGSVIHEKYINPLSDWRGLSPTSAALSDITLDMFASGYARGFFKNNARPDYALETDQSLTPDERQRVEIEIEQKYGGKMHRPMVLEAGQKIHVLSWPMKDLALLELRQPSREAVGAIFGVPDEIMGWGRDTYENFETALKVFWLLTLLPLIQQRDATLTGFFTLQRSLLKPGQRIATDLTGVSVLQEALGPKLEHAAKLWAMGVPFNTLDTALKLGIGQIPGGDVGYLPSAVVAQQTGDVAKSSTPILGYHIDSGTVSRNEARAQLGLPAEDESQDEKLRRLQSQLTVVSAAVMAGFDLQTAVQLVGMPVEVPPEPQQRSFVPTLRLEKAAGRDGVIVALWVPKEHAEALVRLAEGIPNVEPAADLHITLAYLGKISEIGQQREVITLALEQLTRRILPFSGVVNGVIRFMIDEGSGTHALCAAFDCPTLPALRHEMVDLLRRLNVPVLENHGFTPHITLAYVPADIPTPNLDLAQVGVIAFNQLTLAWGDDRLVYPFDFPTYFPMTKASAQRTARALQRIRAGLVPRMEKAIDQVFDDLANRVATRAQEEGKAIEQKKLGVADLLLKTDEDAFRAMFRTWSANICEASWETWNTQVRVDIAFEQSDPAVVAAMRQSGSRVKDIMDYTRDAIRSVLELGASEGWTIDQLVNGVGENAGLKDVVAESYQGRARTIARTELATAQAVATAKRFDVVGVTKVTIYDGGGEDSDDICNQLNGSVQTLAWYEANPLQHPNCVRAAAPYFDD